MGVESLIRLNTPASSPRHPPASGAGIQLASPGCTGKQARGPAAPLRWRSPWVPIPPDAPTAGDGRALAYRGAPYRSVACRRGAASRRPQRGRIPRHVPRQIGQTPGAAHIVLPGSRLTRSRPHIPLSATGTFFAVFLVSSGAHAFCRAISAAPPAGYDPAEQGCFAAPSGSELTSSIGRTFAPATAFRRTRARCGISRSTRPRRSPPGHSPSGPAPRAAAGTRASSPRTSVPWSAASSSTTLPSQTSTSSSFVTKAGPTPTRATPSA